MPPETSSIGFPGFIFSVFRRFSVGRTWRPPLERACGEIAFLLRTIIHQQSGHFFFSIRRIFGGFFGLKTYDTYIHTHTHTTYMESRGRINHTKDFLPQNDWGFPIKLKRFSGKSRKTIKCDTSSYTPTKSSFSYKNQYNATRVV